MLKQTFEGHTGDVLSVAFSPDGNSILSGSSDNTINVWNINGGAPNRSIMSATQIKSISFSYDGRYVASGSEDGVIALFDLSTGGYIRSFAGGHSGFVNAVTFSHDGTRILSGGGDNTVKLWDITIDGVTHSFENNAFQIKSVAISFNDQYALSGNGSAMKLWQIQSTPAADPIIPVVNPNNDSVVTPEEPTVTQPDVNNDIPVDSTIETGQSIHPENKDSIGTAILIAASGAHPENTLFPFSHRFTQEMYRLLIARGFTDETIEYLSPMYPDIDANGFPDDGDGTKDPKRQDYNLFTANEDLKQAFAKAAANLQAGQQFVFYIHGHARKDNLLLSRDYELTATQLKDYLATVPTGIQQIIILDACYSGSFLDDLATVENRIVITSADDANQAWNTEYTSFTDKFILTLRRGQLLRDAFMAAQDTVISEPSLFGDQRPWLDDDQDGVYSTRDGSRAAQVYIGKEGIAAAPPPEITQVHGRIELPEHETTATLWVKVALNPDAIRRVTAVLMPPTLSTKTYEGENTFFGKQEIELIYNPAQNRYEANYTEFRSAGTWRIFYQAQDMQGVSSDIKKGEVEAKGTTLPITVKMVLNQKRYTTDDPLLLDMVLTGTANVDLYVAIVYPSGGFQTITYPFVLSMQNAIQPYQTNVTHSGQKSFSIMNFALPNGIPKGQYLTCGVLVTAGNRQPEDIANWIHSDCPSFEIY